MQAGAFGLVVRSASLCQEQPHLTYTQRREYKQKEVTPQPEKENPRPTLHHGVQAEDSGMKRHQVEARYPLHK